MKLSTKTSMMNGMMMTNKWNKNSCRKKQKNDDDDDKSDFFFVYLLFFLCLSVCLFVGVIYYKLLLLL